MEQVKCIAVDGDERDQQHMRSPIANTDSYIYREKQGKKITGEQAISDGSSFIRVIVIRRILVNHNIDSIEYIKSLIAEMIDLDDVMKSKVYETLSQLIKNNGIKTYFNSWKEKDNNRHTINIIFNKLILEKYVNEYQNIITYKSNQDCYQDVLFNIVDLMSIIFKYLMYDREMKGDLLNCCLVCSHWLYHVYNTHLLNFQDSFRKLIKNTLCYDDNNDDGTNNDGSMLRMWQRLTRLAAVVLWFDQKDDCETSQYQLLLKKLSTVKNVKKLRGRCRPIHVPMFKEIMRQWKEKIEEYSWRIIINSKETNVTSPIMLPNVKHMSIFHLYFYVIWTDRCEKLRLLCLYDIDKQWCDFVIKNCDCSNIKSLRLSEARYGYFENDFINSNNSNQEEEEHKSLKRFVQQFINLKNFSIKFNGE